MTVQAFPACCGYDIVYSAVGRQWDDVKREYSKEATIHETDARSIRSSIFDMHKTILVVLTERQQNEIAVLKKWATKNKIRMKKVATTETSHVGEHHRLYLYHLRPMESNKPGNKYT